MIFSHYLTKSVIFQAVSPTLLIFVIFTQNISNAFGGNILIFTNALSSHSHRVGLEPLVIKLADRGHNITFFTPLKSKVESTPHPNISELCTQELVDANKKFLKEVGARSLKNRVNTKYTSEMDSDTYLFDLIFEMAKCTVESGEVNDLFENSKFDMIILDKSTMGDAILGFAYKFNITKIIYYVGTASLFPWDNDLYGIQNEVSWVPSWQSNYQTKQLSFFDRLQSEISILTWYFGYTQFYLPKTDKLIRDELQLTGMPPLQDLTKSVSLILLNGHYSDTFARSLPPFVVPVGGMHLHESSGILPHDVETFISPEESEKQADEFIYISLGSLFDSSTLPPKLVQIFLDALKSLAPLKFMWKWDGKFPENIPENVILRKWFPQHDVLAHSKCRGFVTQGGQVSMQQGIFNSVPLIIFPVEGDQDYNAKRIRSAGNGIEMEFFDLTAKTLKDAINKLLTDPSYSQAASKLSIASKQRPMHPLDLAVWWTEFVLSQDDVSYLKPRTKNVSWWVTRALDVWAFIFVAIIFLVTVSLLGFYYSVKIVLRICLKTGIQTEFIKRE